MNRLKKLKINTITSLIYQVISIISGFVLPRLILKYYGSSVNGLISSITQFLAVITLCECGVGTVVQSSLYKPISVNDDDEISRICKSAKKFFNKITIILLVYIISLIIIFPNIVNKQYDAIFTSVLIIAIAIGLFSQYYLGIVYKLIINAAQLVYIQMITNSITLILNVIISIILMKNGFSIQIVKIFSAILFVIQPIIYYIVVKKRFNINNKIEYKTEPIKQKWNGFYQHIATVVLENTDVIILTVLASLKDVSIYSVYHLVTNGIKLFMVSITSGMKSLLGDMYVRNEKEKLDKVFSKFEWLIHFFVILVYTITSILIVPFISIYTKGINDANYLQPIFGYIICFSMIVYMIRIPYNYMVSAAGHYKQTQNSAIIEVILNITISVILVLKLGLIGVALGTLIAMLYRTTYLAKYVSKNILYLDFKNYIYHMIFDIVGIIIMIITTQKISIINNNYITWMGSSFIISLICFSEWTILNIIFYNKQLYKFFLDKIRS